jgi:hypothetical protein
MREILIRLNRAPSLRSGCRKRNASAREYVKIYERLRPKISTTKDTKEVELVGTGSDEDVE